MNFKLGIVSLLSVALVGCGGSSSDSDSGSPTTGFVSKNDERGIYASKVDSEGNFLNELKLTLTNESTIFIQYLESEALIPITDNSFSEDITLHHINGITKSAITLTASLNGNSLSTYEIKDEYNQVLLAGAFAGYVGDISNQTPDPISFLDQEFHSQLSGEHYKWLGNNTFQLEKDNCTYIGGNITPSFKTKLLFSYDFDILENTCSIDEQHISKGLIATNHVEAANIDTLGISFQTESNLEEMMLLSKLIN